MGKATVENRLTKTYKGQLNLPRILFSVLGKNNLFMQIHSIRI